MFRFIQVQEPPFEGNPAAVINLTLALNILIDLLS